MKFSPSPKTRDSGADGSGPGLSPRATSPDSHGQEEVAVRLTSTGEENSPVLHLLVSLGPSRDQRCSPGRGPLDSASWPSTEPSQRHPRRCVRPSGTLILLKQTQHRPSRPEEQAAPPPLSPAQRDPVRISDLQRCQREGLSAAHSHRELPAPRATTRVLLYLPRTQAGTAAFHVHFKHHLRSELPSPRSKLTKATD